jgi:hypothetical protein
VPGPGARVIVATLALLAAACTPELDWRELRSDEGRFVALLPGKPRLEERELSGRPGTIMRLWSTRARGAVYGVGYIDAGDAGPPLVASTRDALTTNIGGRLVADREVAMGAARGREFRAEGAEVTLVARVVVAEQRLYQIAVIGRSDNLTADGVETFFSSFRLVQAN